ncbi:MAG: queuosine precursor transporter [Firmicutes bacterium]|nr:queuosine precursor transporter [Bacillota bacterium]
MEKKLQILTALFVTCLLVSNIIAGKLFSWGQLILPAAVFAYPVTFVITDTVSEVWGKKEANRLVWLGLWMSLVMIAFLTLGKFLPPSPLWRNQNAYETILGTVPRMVAASMAAYLVSQLHDVWAFLFWRRVTMGKHLWLRNNLSTIASQFLDTVIFITLAFAGTVAPAVLVNMIISQYLVKIILALADTPFCYLTVRWARKEGVVTDER